MGKTDASAEKTIKGTKDAPVSGESLHVGQSFSMAILVLILSGFSNPARAGVWLSPNLQSADYLALMDSNFLLAPGWSTGGGVNVFKFHDANLNNDANFAPNTLNQFLARNSFARLNSWGIQIAIETGAIKPPPDSNYSWCTGDALKVAAGSYISMIQQNGGVVSYLAMDEPLNQVSPNMSGQIMPGVSCNLPYQSVVNATVNFMSYLSDNFPSVQLIDIEPYPTKMRTDSGTNSSADDLWQWVNDIQSRLRSQGKRPLTALHLDINREIGYNIADPANQAVLIQLANRLHSMGIRFGIIYWGQRDQSNETYVQDVLNFYVDTRNLRAVTDDFIFQNWFPSQTTNTLSIPLNVWQDGVISGANHIGLIQSAQKYNATVQRGGTCGTTATQIEYLGFYPDIRAAGINPFLHYELFGRNEGRCQIVGHCTFPISAAGYLTIYPDVAAAGIDPVLHYKLFGQYEGRCPIQ